MARILFLLLCTFLISSEHVLAATSLRVRIGEHAQYSRMVFDWTKRVGFDIKKPSNDRLVISFNEDANIDASSLSVGDITNINSVNIVSETPLTLSIDILPNSKTRNFYAGDRLVLDVYNPPSAPLNKAPLVKKKALVAKKVSEIKKIPEIKEKKGKHLYEARKIEQESLEKTTEKVEIPSQTVLEKAVKSTGAAETHVITVTSTQNVGMASFEMYNDLWVVTDKNEFYLKPQLNGPKKEEFSGFEEATIEKGLASKTSLPKWAHIRGQGGGLLWRLIISSEDKVGKPVGPIRNLRPQNEIHGGILIWPFSAPSQILAFTEPTFNEDLIVVTTNSAKDFTGPVYDFVEFEILESHIGMVIRPKVDDLIVEIIPQGVQITRPGGLATMSDKMISSVEAAENPENSGTEEDESSPKIYSFNEWQISSADLIFQNENIILRELKDKEKEERGDGLMTLAKMFLSQGYGAEAIGYLDFAASEAEGLETNPDFLALRGAANVLAWKSDNAFEDLSIKELKQFKEIGFWRATVLADLADWRQAYEVMPTNLNTLYKYPEIIRRRLALTLAEVALRAGDVDTGEELLALLGDRTKNASSELTLEEKSALAYLRGEAHRQAGEAEETQKLWEELSVGKDPLYRAKAKLALTRLLSEAGSISQEQAIDNLESLRYAWRGDQLEASINYWLGRTYFDAKEYVRGLNIMREAITYAPGTNLGKKITEEMTTAFTNLYLETELEGVSALDAVAIYEQFRELTPVGDAGDKIVEILSERLVEADLLGRAGNMMELQIESRLSGSEAARLSVRLAAIRLLDDAPDKALTSLNRADRILKGLESSTATPKRLHEIKLLRARAHSQAKETDAALKILNDLPLTPDVNRLRADISWQASYWEDAAEALNDVIVDNNISLTRPLNDEAAALILQRAVALNLDDDRIALINLREKYSDVMLQTSKARLFEVVTRPRQNTAMADQNTLRSMVSEVDVFEGFLKSYIDNNKNSN